MKKRSVFFILSSFFIFLLTPSYAGSGQEQSSLPELIFFFSPHCHECAKIKNELMPAIEHEVVGKAVVRYRDIEDIENYKLLLQLQEKYNVKLGSIVPLFYLKGNFFEARGKGRPEIEAFIARALAAPQKEKDNVPAIDIISHFRRMTLLALSGAALFDGINPCAFTVIVFFISFLVLQRYRKREVAIIGVSFIFTVFVTYLFIGLGLLAFLYRIAAFWLAARIFNLIVGGLSIVLGFFCIYDFFSYARTKDTLGVYVQLPKLIKFQIHKIIGEYYRVPGQGKEGAIVRRHAFGLIVAAVVSGFLVSILEFVCTGQVYLPTIVAVFKTTHLKWAALGYLVWYNFLFIVPLVLVFLCALMGATSEDFAKFFAKHFLLQRLLMAGLFFALGAYVIWGERILIFLAHAARFIKGGWR